jgi:hypothetical protein
VKNSAYEVEVIFEHNDFNFIKDKEKEFIKLYGRVDLGTGSLINQTSGGQGRSGALFSDSEKEKRRNYPKGKDHPRFGIPISDEHKKAISAKLKGVPRPDISERNTGRKVPLHLRRSGEKAGFFGRKHTEESKRKISIALTGLMVGEKNYMYGKKDFRLANYMKSIPKEEWYWYGRELTDEHKNKLRVSNLGVKRTDETCENNRQAQIKRFKTSKHPGCKLVLNLDSGVFYDSAKEAALVFGYKKTTLIGILNGKSKTKINLIYA